ncbi:chitin synthase I [Ascoidea rubescens DSM 1968]|uniref:chitin synthase n=1 Tax=Ascoidea rubescens DSM 1968 TaxID=1344418 RepID=A0A1D2V9U3_9ASCO|nr:glycosyltransferase family 2 protein [Ascoidea rubescens DSM 1968]ODV58404.1 glycosyltransferase family 2 protein [Ascoidea rubescens DSM 1968]
MDSKHQKLHDDDDDDIFNNYINPNQQQQNLINNPIQPPSNTYQQQSTSYNDPNTNYSNDNYNSFYDPPQNSYNEQVIPLRDLNDKPAVHSLSENIPLSNQNTLNPTNQNQNVFQPTSQSNTLVNPFDSNNSFAYTNNNSFNNSFLDQNQNTAYISPFDTNNTINNNNPNQQSPFNQSIDSYPPPPPPPSSLPSQQTDGFLQNLFYSNNNNSSFLDDVNNDPDFQVQFPVQGDSYELYKPITVSQNQNLLPDQTGYIPPNNNANGEGNSDDDDDNNDDDNDDNDDDDENDQEKKNTFVRTFLGNFVLDCPVPSNLLKNYKHEHSEREFCYMRYSAATCDPHNFTRNKFSLRQTFFQPRRPTELLIVVTMYNEEDHLLGRTLRGVMNNIKYICNKGEKDTWGPDGWKKIVVCVVSDGRTKINKRSKALLSTLGCYQEGFARSRVNEKDVTAHLYEYTSLVGIKTVKDGVVQFDNQNAIPVQFLFCLKENNQKKINSHRWCFEAFCPILDPEVVVLLDAGTEPSDKSIYHLWKCFKYNPQVGGACGEIKALLGPKGKYLLNPLVAGQNFEYKMSNILDKPTESVFGFISVLPGAFSAYRLNAVRNNELGEGPLKEYFKGETLHNEPTAGIFTKNMYLAEDRILCFEIVSKKRSNWVLRYVKSASAKTDVPDQLDEFILQRRRWLNGSFFAAVYSVFHFHRIYTSGHSIPRKFLLTIEGLYNLVNLILSWFSLGCYFLVFRILTLALADPDINFAPGNVLALIFLWLYVASTVSVFVCAFGNTPKGTKKMYITIVVFYAILMIYMFFAAIFLSVKSVQLLINEQEDGHVSFTDIVNNSTVRNLVISLLSTYVLYFLASFLYAEPWHMFTSFLQYILLSPSYINVLNIYAFCNIHDISWGTKGDDGHKEDLGAVKVNENGVFELVLPTTDEQINASYSEQARIIAEKEIIVERVKTDEEKSKDDYAFYRTAVVLLWMATNFIIIAVVLNTGGISELNEIDTSSRKLIKRGFNLFRRMAADTATDTATADTTDTADTTATETTTTTEATLSITDKNSQIFLGIILWLVAFMAAFRFVGCFIYLILHYSGR